MSQEDHIKLYKHSLYIDHDHNKETNNVRGILCKKCNYGIAYFNDNKQLLDNTKEYLKND